MRQVAVDSSSLIGYLNGFDRPDTSIVETVLSAGEAVLPPLVVAETLSLPTVDENVATLVRSLPQLPIEAGYWERAGLLRAHVLATGRRARMADTLIAQSCIDHDVPLVTADADFRSFAAHGLRLVE